MGSSISAVCRRLMGHKEIRVLIVGLDAAGKTSILYRLKLGDVMTTIPTIGFNVETIEHKNVSITSWDIGGRDKARALWRHYYQNTQALIFVVDSTDRERIQDAKEDLHRVFNEDELKDAVLLVFANKQDLPNAMGKNEVVEKLSLSELRNTQWYAIGCSAFDGEGLYEGLDWLVDVLALNGVQKSVSETAAQVVTDANLVSGKLASVEQPSLLKQLTMSINSWFGRHPEQVESQAP